ncbi:MAG: hypothetical protein M0Z50_15680 [Planctomycetia bacterium]|nr:hypothetical protein [Planctomycetia bacterium]
MGHHVHGRFPASLPICLLGCLLSGGCGVIPVVSPGARPNVPPAATPRVALIAPPIQHAITLNKKASQQVSTLTPANLPAQKPVLARTLTRQAVYLHTAMALQTQAVPAVKAADEAVRNNAQQVIGLQNQLKQLRQRQVQMTLTGGLVAAALFLFAGVFFMLALHSFVEGAALILIGISLIGLVWFASAHMAWIEWGSATAVPALVIWMIWGRHLEHVLRTAAPRNAATAAK